MAGLLGNIDPNNPNIGIAAGLLSGRGNVGANLAVGLLSAQQTAAANRAFNLTEQAGARADQQAELSALVQSYKVLSDIDRQARNNALFTGQPYTPSPEYVAIQRRLSALIQPASPAPMLGTGTPRAGLLSSNNGTRDLTPGVQYSGNGQPYGPGVSGSAIPAPMPTIPPQAQPAPMPSISAPANAAPMPGLPAPNVNAPPMPGGPQIPQAQGQPTIPELLQRAGIDPRMAAMWASTPQGENELYKQLAQTYGPHVTNGIMLQLQPNGGARFLGGAISRNAVPVVTDAQGNPQVLNVPGAIAYQAQREGAVSGAQEDAKAARDLVPIPQTDGTVRYMTRAQAIGQTGQAQSGGFPGTVNGQIPPNVQAQRDQGRLQILLSERARQQAAGQVDPALEREIQLAQGGVNFAGERAPGFSAGQSTAAKTAAEVNPKLQLESLAKSYDDNLKAANGLVFLDAARKAVNGATTTGLFAKPALLAARVGSAFGVTDAAAAADPETFMALAARSVMQTIKSLGSGSGISDSDREYAAKAMGGDIKLNKESINRLLDIQERATRMMVQQHNRKVDQAAASGVPSVYDYRIDIPQSSGGSVVALPDGRTARFPNAQAAEQFKRAAGMQ